MVASARRADPVQPSRPAAPPRRYRSADRTSIKVRHHNLVVDGPQLRDRFRPVPVLLQGRDVVVNCFCGNPEPTKLVCETVSPGGCKLRADGHTAFNCTCLMQQARADNATAAWVIDGGCAQAKACYVCNMGSSPTPAPRLIPDDEYFDSRLVPGDEAIAHLGPAGVWFQKKPMADSVPKERANPWPRPLHGCEGGTGMGVSVLYRGRLYACHADLHLCCAGQWKNSWEFDVSRGLPAVLCPSALPAPPPPQI